MPDHQPASGLLADLYELTMAAGYFETGFEARATFELFVRKLPPQRNFLVAAGLDQAIEFLEGVRFSAEEIAYLRTTSRVCAHPRLSFFDYLAAFRFSGDVAAMPEGTVYFPGEPLLRVTAPIAEAQIVETALLATVSFQTMIASKAARIVEAASGRPVIEFGARRAHGVEAGIFAARAGFIGGCLGTSNVKAGYALRHTRPMARRHTRGSWRTIPKQEAFAHFLDIFPQTFRVAARHLRRSQSSAKGDRAWAASRAACGSIAATSLPIACGCASGSMRRAGATSRFSFPAIWMNSASRRCSRRGARVDTFGVGTSLTTSLDAPSLSVLYKLVEVERNGQVRSAAKFSDAKVTYPGCKQVYRASDSQGHYAGDVIALENEPPPDGEPLLVPVMRAGLRLAPVAAYLSKPRNAAASKSSGCLPCSGRCLPAATDYPVRHSTRLEQLLEQVRERVAPVTPV